MRLNDLQRRTLTFLLTIWFTLVSGGVSLTHAHAVSHKTCLKNHSSPVPASPEQVHLHRHLVLFGIEWPYELPPDSSTPPTGKAEWVLLVDVKCDKGCLTDTLHQVDGDRISICDKLALPGIHSSIFPELLTPAPLSPFALHNTSGVLRF